MIIWTIVLVMCAGIVTAHPITSQYNGAPALLDITGSDDLTNGQAASVSGTSNWKVNEQMLHLPREQSFQRLQRSSAEIIPLESGEKRYASEKDKNVFTIWKRIVIDCKQQPLQKMLKLSSNEIFGQDNGNFQNLRMIFQHCFLNKDGIRF